MHMMPRAGRTLGIGAVLLTLALLGCTDLNQTPFVPVVTNEVDNFDFLVIATTATRTVRYTWTTTGGGANVTLASNIASGSARVTITDGDNTQVFDHALDGSGATVTSAATPGNWLIIMTLSGVSGTIHFSLQKP